MQHDLHIPSPLFADSSDLTKVESLKKEVDFYIRTDAKRAMDLADSAYEIALHTNDSDARTLGFRAKALALHVAGRYEEAIAIYRQAKRIYESDSRLLESARVARSMADALMYLGRYDEALSLAVEARAIFRSLNEPLLAAQADTNLGNIYHRLDRYQEALDRYQSAMQVFSQAGDPTALAVGMFNTANIHSNLDDFREAEKLYQASHDIYVAQGMELAAAQAKYSLGYLHFLKGAYHPAMRSLHEVIDEFRRLGDDRFVMLCGLDLSEIYLRLNLLEETIRQAREACDAARHLQLRYEAAKALTYLGLAQMHQSKLTKAEEALREAETLFQDEANHVYVALVRIYLAELALKRLRPDEALAMASQAEVVLDRQYLVSRTRYARLIIAKATALRGDVTKALELGDRLLEEREHLNESLLYQVHEFIGSVLGEQNASRAEHHYRQAAECIERIRNGIAVDDFRSAFLKNKLPIYDKLIELCLKQAADDKHAAALFYLESQKARTLVDVVGAPTKQVISDRPNLIELRNRWRQLQEELHWYNSKANQSERSVTRSASTTGTLREHLRARERSLEELSRQMQVLDPDFVPFHDSPGLTIQELRAALHDTEVVVEYYFQGETLKLFIIDKSEFRVVDGPNSRAEINAMILELRFHLDKMNYGSHVAVYGDRLLQSCNDSLLRLYKALIGPAAPFVAGRKIIFVPFDNLHSVPFPALFDGTTYLADLHEIVIAPSARLFVACASKPACGYSHALILGSADQMAPQINREVRAIYGRFATSSCFTGAEATSTALAKHAAKADVLHIASHAVFRRDSPMFSALRLADKWLNCYDISSLRLPNPLVTLSGCRTGAHGILAGDEVSGLVRAFLSAGAGALVVSLWPVNDSATAQMMSTFYDKLQSGLSPCAALRSASLEIRRGNPNPWYWAPFVFIGGH